MFKTVTASFTHASNYKNVKVWFFTILSVFTSAVLVFCIAQPTRMFFFIPKPDPAYASELNSENGKVFVYIVDSGVDNTVGNMYYHVAKGYDAIEDKPGGNIDCTGHGTGVASIVAGMVEVEDVTIVPVKTAKCGHVNDPVAIIRGINWIIDNHPKNAPIGVINLSFGYVDNIPFLDGIQNAVQSALDAGFVVTVSAGNESKVKFADGVDSVTDACLTTPANVPDVITVGAALATGGKAVRSGFSNSGSCVDLFAPGEGVYAFTKDKNGNFSENLVQGTSYASPYVAAVAAEKISSQRSIDRFGVEKFLKEKALKGELVDTEVNRLEPDVPTVSGSLTPNLFLNVDVKEESPPCVFDLSNFFVCR